MSAAIRDWKNIRHGLAEDSDEDFNMCTITSSRESVARMYGSDDFCSPLLKKRISAQVTHLTLTLQKLTMSTNASQASSHTPRLIKTEWRKEYDRSKMDDEAIKDDTDFA